MVLALAGILSAPPASDPRHLEVKFRDGLSLGLDARGAPFERAARALRSRRAVDLLEGLRAAGGTWARATGADEATIDRLVATAEVRLGRRLANLNNYFRLELPAGEDAAVWLDRLGSLPEVERAAPGPLPVPAPFPGDLSGQQGYLGPCPGGLDADWAWSAPGGTGAAVQICDLEYSWNAAHLDLPALTTILPAGYSAQDPFENDNHGTAVAGAIASLRNGWGTTGAGYGAGVCVAPVYLRGPGQIGYSVQIGVAITAALAHLVAGDIILIEQQAPGPNYTGEPFGTQVGLVPVEWEKSAYDAILVAIGNGVHVVEAGGNGSQDLDDPVYATGNGGHWPFLPANRSGALVVGAGAVSGGSDVDRSRLALSNYGSRLDLQGWGERICTTGYGDLYAAEGPNLWFTAGFGQTSGAAATVAASLASLEGAYESLTGGSLSPALARSTLVSTGSPQQAGAFPAAQKIGPRPCMRDAIAALPATAVEASLVRAEATHDRVVLEWEAPRAAGLEATIERREEPGDWVALGGAVASGTGRIRFEDPRVRAGVRYGYRFFLPAASDPTRPLGEVWVTVPATPGLALEGARPNPAVAGDLRVAFTLPGPGRATLELIDLSGRRWVAREAGSLGPGSHVVRLEGDGAPAGLYFLRLTWGGKTLVARVALLR